ncbi:MAG: hypothetical protein HOA34_01275 [Flavobacterium sp.]|nr:hypothetical protein [Flavobacterium sp.]
MKIESFVFANQPFNSSRGKISSLMGDVAKGIKSFKKGMASDVTEDTDPKNISENNQDSENKD